MPIEAQHLTFDRFMQGFSDFVRTMEACGIHNYEEFLKRIAEIDRQKAEVQP